MGKQYTEKQMVRRWESEDQPPPEYFVGEDYVPATFSLQSLARDADPTNVYWMNEQMNEWINEEKGDVWSRRLLHTAITLTLSTSMCYSKK